MLSILAISETYLALKHFSRVQGMLPESLVACTIIRVDELEMVPSLYLFRREPSVVTPALVRVLMQAVGLGCPHELWHCLGKDAKVLLVGFELLLRSLLRSNMLDERLPEWKSEMPDHAVAIPFIWSHPWKEVASLLRYLETELIDV